MHTALVRLLVVLTCYGLSGFGLIAVIFGLPSVFSSAGSLPGAITLLVWISAISALFRMSFSWVRNVRLGAQYSRRAFLLGLSAILVIPIFTLPQALGSHYQEASVQVVLLVAMEVLLVLPAIVLAVYLNRFHATHEPQSRT